MATTFGHYARTIRSSVTGDAVGFFRSLARWPLVYEAERTLDSLPVIELSRLTGAVTVRAAILEVESRHDWSLGTAEQFVLQALISSRAVTTVFEIGTFNGGTTRVIAEALPASGHVTTVDLPVAEFNRTQGPRDFTGDDVGHAYRGRACESKIEQLRVDSRKLCLDQYRHRYDLVLVDGAHDYEHGIADSRIALELIKPGGIVLWDDFTSYWHGLVKGIVEVVAPMGQLGRLAGTSLGVYVA